MKLIKIGVLVLMTALWACSDDSGSKADGGGGGGGDGAATGDKGVGGDKGTPKPDAPVADADTSQFPVIEKMIPSDGPSDGGKGGEIPVTLVGKNFKPGMTVYVDGGQAIISKIQYTSTVSISFMMPKNPYGPPYTQTNLVTVSVNNGVGTSKGVDFQYWVAKDQSATDNGYIVTPSHEAFRDFASPPVEVRIFSKGITDTTTGESTQVKVQIGIGRSGDDPATGYSFIWTDAKFVKDDGAHDVYATPLTPPLQQDYAIVARFTTNGGRNYTFVDAVDDSKYTASDAGTLKVVAAPQGYCTKKLDCASDAYRKVCKLDPNDWKKHRCIECKTTADCKANPSALGPTCDTTTETCGCAGDGECKGRTTGFKCLKRQGGGTVCGCGSDDDCDWPNGQQCAQSGICQ